MLHGVQQRTRGRHGAEAHRTQQGGQELQPPYLLAQLGNVRTALVRPCKLDHPRHRRPQRVRRHRLERGGAHRRVGRALVEQHGAGLLQPERGGVEVTQCAQPGALAGLLGIGREARDHGVEQLEHVVLRRRLQRPHVGQQRRRPPLLGHSGDGLGAGGAGVAGQGRDAPGWHPVGRGQAVGQGAHLAEALDGAPQLGRGLQHRAVAQPVKGALSAVLAGLQQGFQPGALRRGHAARQGAPQALGGPRPHLGDQAFQHRRPRQQDLVDDQPGDGAVEQGAGSV